MLPSQHKITSSEEFRKTIRSGKRAGGGTVVLHVLFSRDVLTPKPRCGLVVSKAVGNAVTRHAVSRKLRAIIRPLFIVIRALPAAAHANSEELSHDVQRALAKIRER